MRHFAWIALFGLVGCDKAAEESDGPTYYADVKPILDQNCMRCHAEGGVAPSSFTSPEIVKTLSPLIKTYVESGYMPPPAPNPECAAYEDSERYTLDENEKSVLLDWIATGMALGDETTAETPVPEKTLAPWDVELRGAEPYLPEFDATGNDYRCWAIEVGNEDSLYVTGLEAIVDNNQFVHHAVLFNDGTEWSGNADPNDADGFPCDGFGQGDWEFMHGWGPGSSPISFPAGMGMQLPAHAKVVVQAHYFDNGTIVPDNTAYGLLTAPTVDRQIYQIPVEPGYFKVPANDPDYNVGLDFTNDFGVAITVISIWPHMHLLGNGFDMAIEHANGTTDCLVHMDDYDFHNQVPVTLDTPIVLGNGDKVTMSCNYDNSADNPNNPNDPPADVELGEGTNQEMCFGFTYAFPGTL